MVLFLVVVVGSSIAAAWLLARFLVSRGWGECEFNPNIVGKVVLVTGGNSGIGLQTAKYLSEHGAQVIIAARNDEKSAQVVAKLARQNQQNVNFVDVDWMHLDLNSFASVREFAAKLLQKYPRLDIVIHNAGVYGPPYKINEDRFETQMCVNHLGNVLLTRLLMPRLTGNGEHDPAKILMVNSALYKRGKVEDCYFGPMTEQEFLSTSMYANSKLCSLLYARRLAIELSQQAKHVTVNILSPGLVLTDVTRYQRFKYLKFALLTIPLGWFTKTPHQGAQTTLQCAMHSTLSENGKWFSNCKQGTFAAVADRQDWTDKVWTLTNQLIGINQNK